jgi:hypothetical protein
MKSFTTKLLESTASPIYLATIVEDNDSIIELNIVINEGDDLETAVNFAYTSLKNPFKPIGS